MKTLNRMLAIATACGAVGVIGSSYLLADGPPLPRSPRTAPPAPPAPPTTDAKTPAAKDEAPINPIKITDEKIETKTAVTPKPLSPAVKKGLAYLIKQQQEDGGWNQGGGWRTSGNGGGRVEGAKVEDPSDVGNTCVALLALVRAGSTPTTGDHKEAVQKGLRYLIGRIEKSDKDSLYVTDVRGTQLQSKIGSYVDTFLANLVLAELKGKAGDDEKKLVAALEKTMTKIVKHQTAEGGFAGNAGWAPVLSVGLANKGIARAKANGVIVDDKFMERALAQSKQSVAGTTGTSTSPGSSAAAVGPSAPTAAPALDGFSRGGRSGAYAAGAGGGDAGVALYRIGQGAGNTQDVVNGLRIDGEKAKKVLADEKATKEDKEKASTKLEQLKKAETENAAVQRGLAVNVQNDGFVAGFGSNGGEEFLSFLNISEALLVKGGKEWEAWDTKMVKGLEKAQDGEGSWSGHHCITGKTFCTGGALLVLMADRTVFPVDVLKCNDQQLKPATPMTEPKATSPTTPPAPVPETKPAVPPSVPAPAKR